jgi:uncharacterized protein (TIGR02594 family)
VETTPYQIAERFVGLEEVPGAKDNPFVLGMLQLDDLWPEHDEVPWCSAFVNWVFWLLRLPRSKRLSARSWLQVGEAIPLEEASVGHDIVVLWRGDKDGPNGHVGFFSGRNGDKVALLGGNQDDSVCVQEYPVSRVLGVRRIQ